jgi:hypothetical protein
MRWFLLAVLAGLVAGCGDNLAPPAPDADSSADVAAVPPGCVAGRATDDRPDDTGRDQIRVLYVTAADGEDLGRDTSGQICNSVRGVATWFEARAGVFLRLDTMDGLLDVGFVRLDATDAELRGSDPANQTIETGVAFVRERLELGLRARGEVVTNKLYAVFYEGTSSYSCGGGAYPPLIVGRVGAVYLRGTPGGQQPNCGDTRPWGEASLVPDYIDYAILHELVHSLGFVAAAAPHEHSSGHAFDAGAPDPARDLMYSPRPGMPDPPWNIDHPDGVILDINRDDYFATTAPYDLARSSLLAPLPADARRPIGW